MLYRHATFTFRMFVPVMLSVLTVLIFSAPLQGATLRLAIQPALTPEKTLHVYQPLADYLSQATGEQVKIVVSPNFQAYWSTLISDSGHDMALDAAHFADYRSTRLGYTILAKVNDTLSFSLVTREDKLVLGKEELIGRAMAAVPSPSLAGVNLADYFPNPSRQPTIVTAKNFPDALEKVLDGKAMATIVPTSLIRGDSRFNTVEVTKAVPHSAFSVSSRVKQSTQRKIRNALVNAQFTESGRAMLQAIMTSGFEAADTHLYDGYAHMLDGVWGY